MRIDLNGSSLNGVQPQDSTQKVAAKAAGKTNQHDTASLSVDTLGISTLETQALSFPEVRLDKVHALRQAIQSEQYKVEPDKVAQAIIAQNAR
jgi:flagellar biosynthesis anti-sigma factor FlgM